MQTECDYLKNEHVFPESIISCFIMALNDLDEELTLKDILNIKSLFSYNE